MPQPLAYLAEAEPLSPYLPGRPSGTSPPGAPPRDGRRSVGSRATTRGTLESLHARPNPLDAR